MENWIASLLLWVLSAAASVVSVVLGTILAYHWFKFGSNFTISLVALAAYAAGCSVLLSALFALSAVV